MKILVTGAIGFIGFHLCEALLLAGHKVVGLDNINDYYDRELKLSRLKALGVEWADDTLSSLDHNSNTLFQFIYGDITDSDKIERLFNENSIDIVINLAAQAGVRYSLENPTAYVETNVLGFQYLIDAAYRNKVKHFIYASSSSIYGFNESIPFQEDDRVDHPVSMYAATKRSSELMAHTYSHLYDFPTSGLRFFTVYGPWGRPDMAPFLFTKSILEGKPIKVFNNGNLFRDFTYIDDIINGIMGLIKAGSMIDQKLSKPYSIFNIGNSKPINLMDFIELLEVALGVEAKKDFLPMQPGDVYKTYADVSKLAGHTGYNPTTDLQEGIKKFVGWYRDYYAI